jgi:hypothetical protein
MIGIPTTELVFLLCHKETVKVELGLKVKFGVLFIKYWVLPLKLNAALALLKRSVVGTAP